MEYFLLGNREWENKSLGNGNTGCPDAYMPYAPKNETVISPVSLKDDTISSQV